MMSAIDAARYFLSKDDGTVFTNQLVERSGRKFYDGNARLNKYLHIAQLLYIAKNGTPLFEDDLYAYDNGAVVPSVQENYMMLKLHPCENITISDDERSFLDKIYNAFRNVDLEDLIEISHEDESWLEKHFYYNKQQQRMEPMLHVEKYRQQYADMLEVLERM